MPLPKPQPRAESVCIGLLSQADATGMLRQLAPGLSAAVLARLGPLLATLTPLQVANAAYLRLPAKYSSACNTNTVVHLVLYMNI